ncbi:uncharacterized protein LOC109708129 [Ananas comosus]|uniref:Uncharacterized protein LOC109708129 n=1 Tax=Ananas comosus TaxID=4615 RepID=A0A6P5EVM7_ANACO|nr:uncharacterized protein LOC109708129 [Ananas comosus]
MAMVMDQQQQQQQQQQQPQPPPTYKHYCRICKKGFGCGRALGGHMRAHGINDEASGGNDLDDDPSACGGNNADHWDAAANPSVGHKRMYALRTNPNRLKSCRVCENCGKEFVSWKSFLEHGKCSSDDEVEDSLPSSPPSDAEDDLVAAHRGYAAWSKGKRSRRAKNSAPAMQLVCPSSEEEDLANCLVMLSAARVDPVVVVDTDQESCASASKDEDRARPQLPTPPHPISFFAPPHEKLKSPVPPTATATATTVPRGLFECKACKKVFTSHQALGGHRASHKKVKGCFAAKLDELDDARPHDDDHPAAVARDSAAAAAAETDSAVAGMAMAIVPFSNPPPLAAVAPPPSPLKKKSKVHECSICHRVFTSGQALGGHKRCHWLTSNSPSDSTAIAKLHALAGPDHAVNHHHHHLTLRPMFEANSGEPLDLNLPAPADEAAGGRHADIGSPLRLDVPATIYLQSWIDHSSASNKVKPTTSSKNNNTTTTNNNNNNTNNKSEGFNVNNNNNNNNSVDDEVDSNVKMAKLSDLKDINMGGESSPWLQVGIGSSGNEGSEP